MTLTGIFKNILLVVVSIMIWHTQITAMQFFGYGIALLGLLYYSVGYDQLAKAFHTSKGYISLRTSSSERLSTGAKRWICAGVGLVVFSSILAVLYIFNAHEAIKGQMEKLPAWFGST